MVVDVDKIIALLANEPIFPLSVMYEDRIYPPHKLDRCRCLSNGVVCIFRSSDNLVIEGLFGDWRAESHQGVTISD